MPDVTIWAGSSSFMPGDTPFGFYDLDADFQRDADKVASFCATRLGFPLMDVELQSGSLYACFEEAVTVYGNEVFQYKIRENYLSMEGGDRLDNLNNAVIRPSLQRTIDISSEYGTEAEVGGKTPRHTGSINLRPGQQDYDLNEWALEQGITGSIDIRRVFYQAPPAIVRYFDPYAGTGTGVQGLMDQFGFGNYSPGINFLLMPVSFDVQKIQAIEFNDQIRKSAYSFEIVNNMLRVFPLPQNRETGTLRFEFYKDVDKRGLYNKDQNGNGVISNVGEVPYENPSYFKINSVGRQWIYRYALALSKEVLGYIRGKYSTLPIPGSEATLNQQDLLSDAETEKAELLLQLREMLDQTSRNTQLEKKAQESQYIQDTLNSVPMTIFIG